MIDQFQRQMRAGRIGGSDAAAACGLSPWTTAYDLWAEKTGRVTRGFVGNAATVAGTYLEVGLINYLEDRLGSPVQRDVLELHADGVRCVNLDGYMPFAPTPAIVEAKTAGIAGRGQPVGWGDPDEGADGIPPHVLIQLHHAFGVMENPAVQVAHVVACLGGRGICCYRVPRNQGLVDAVAERVLAFVDLYVKRDTPPPDSAPSLDVAKVLVPVPDKVVPLPAELVQRWTEAKAALKVAAEQEKQARAEVLGAMVDAEAGDFPGGRVTCYGADRAEYTVKPSYVRTLRIKLDNQLARKRA